MQLYSACLFRFSGFAAAPPRVHLLVKKFKIHLRMTQKKDAE